MAEAGAAQVFCSWFCLVPQLLARTGGVSLPSWFEQEEDAMQCSWEQIGVLGPIYQLVSRGLSDSDIADKLGVTELSVQSCVAWILHFLKFTSREELILYAADAA